MYAFDSPELARTKQQIKKLYGLINLPHIYGFILMDERNHLFTGIANRLWSEKYNDAMATTRFDKILELASLAGLRSNEVRVGILFYGDEADGKRSMIPFDSAMTVNELRDRQRLKTLRQVL